jgi:drug/metabolite transporter (DMT)-like permease
VATWGTAYSAIRVAVRWYSPGALALGRFGIASVVIATIVAATPQARFARPTARDLAGLFVTGIIGVAIYSVSVNWGERTVDAGTTGLLLSTSPILTALIAWPAIGERLPPLGWGGAALAFVGTALVAVSTGGVRLQPGVPIVLLAAVSWSVYTVMQKAYLGRYSPLAVTAYTFWGATLALLPFAPALLRSLRSAPMSATGALLYLGVVPAGVAFLTWAYVCARLSASRAATTSNLVAPMGVLVAWLTLREVPRTLALVGGAVTIAGVAVVNAVRAPSISATPPEGA